MEPQERELIFKALADRHRRKLLDILFRQNGQTLTALCDHFDMTRHGVMKHLRILEDAELIITQKVGREKYHYLNPVPIQVVYDRWVSKYAQPWAHSLVGLKDTLEGRIMTAVPAHMQQIFINTTPEKLWEALTNGTFTKQYYMGTAVESTWENGAGYRYVNDDGNPLLDGKILEIDPPKKLVTTFNTLWVDETERGESTTVTFEIEPVGSACKLTLIHEGLEPGKPLTQGLQAGWAQILSGLKTLLETGEPLVLE